MNIRKYRAIIVLFLQVAQVHPLAMVNTANKVVWLSLPWAQGLGPDPVVTGLRLDQTTCGESKRTRSSLRPSTSQRKKRNSEE